MAAAMTAASCLPRLSPATIGQARPGCVRPGYDRAALRTGIVHLGLGAFVRAHVATYTDDLLAIEPGAWGIAGVSLQRPDQRNRLAPQDGLYTALQRDGDGIGARIIGCVRAALVAPEDPAAVVTTMAQPDCRIVSLTVTEKGYCHDPATGRLDARHADIRHDLEHPAAPRSAIGLIVAALGRRRAAGLAPFTVLCCDNLPHNGALVARLAYDFAALRDDGLATWIDAQGAFPSTMVDRIVPATTDADIAAAAEASGLYDAAPVSHEPFRQWVIEDRFVAHARPAWDRVGAQFVADVAPYEHMKLRLLNGAHSALAYLGFLAGHETISDTVADDVLGRYVVALWRDEIIPVVPPPPGTDLHHYATELLARFANPAIRHRTWQIAMDGSQKLPQRLLGTARDLIAMGRPFGRVAFGIAAWMRYVTGIDEKGAPIDVRDPLAGTLRKIADEAGPDAARLAPALLSVEAVFGRDLAADPRFAGPVTAALDQLFRVGAKAAALNAAQGAL
jgi:fructuronate reductase